MTKQEEIVNAFKLKLQDIKTSNGFLTNIGNNVNDWNADPIPDGTSEYVEIRDQETTFLKKNDEGYLELAHKQLLKLVIVIIIEKKSISYARQAVADIYKLIGNNKWYFWEVHQIIIRPVNHVFDIQKEDRTITGANVELEIEFVTNEWGIDEPV